MIKKQKYRCESCACKQTDPDAKLAPNYCGMYNIHWSQADRHVCCKYYIPKGKVKANEKKR